MKKVIFILYLLLTIQVSFVNNNAIMHTEIFRTLYVGGEGPNNYTRIQDAIDNASDGDTIIVYYGTYNESIEVDKTLYIIGKEENGKKPVILCYKNIVVNITANNCTFKFFKVMALNRTAYAINLLSNKNSIEGNVIEGGFIGISLFYSSYNTIRSNVIRNTTETALSIDHSHNNIIESNEIINNEWDGIALFASNNNIVTKNEIKWNECGITLMAYSRYNEIKNNNVSENTNYGITIQHASNNKVIGNYIYKNKEWCGISIIASSNIVSKNIIIANKWAGIYIGGRRNIISKNIIKDSKFGLFLEGYGGRCRNNVIIGNDFVGNKIHVSFWFEQYLFPLNLFFRNYWENWYLPLPKPILGTWSIIIPFHGEMDIPWFYFDWSPRILPMK